jgi:hypothetical protein
LLSQFDRLDEGFGGFGVRRKRSGEIRIVGALLLHRDHVIAAILEDPHRVLVRSAMLRGIDDLEALLRELGLI